MDFFIQNAMAEGGAPASAGMADFIPLILLFVIFYFMLIRPQMKRAKEHKALIEGLDKGDEVITGGGLCGKIIDLGDNFALVEVSKDMQVKVQRGAISTVLPKGSLKEL